MRIEPASRFNFKSEEIKNFWAHNGTCAYCNGIVKMSVSRKTFEPQPDKCSCLFCGQKYFVVTDDIEKWMGEQWIQKNNQNNPENN